MLAQAKHSRREATPTVEFKGQTGLLVPTVLCKTHTNHKRPIYDICETNDAGEVRNTTFFLSPLLSPVNAN